jgi:hypothetical protein
MEKKTVTANNSEQEIEDEIYFGNVAKNAFYKRCLWLQSQGEIVTDSLSNSQFDASKNALDFSRKGWKGRKKDKNKMDYESNSISDDTQSTRSSSLDSIASHSIYSHSNSRISKLSLKDSKNFGSPLKDSSIRNKDHRNSYTTANKNIYTTNLKLLSPRTRFISSCMKEGNCSGPLYSHRRFFSDDFDFFSFSVSVSA